MEECTVRETYLADLGWPAIELQNRWLRVLIVPDKGADIYAIQCRQHNDLDLLWKAPWQATMPGRVLAANSKRAWMDAYPGGWQLMFPNVGDDCRYQGSDYGFHGEACLVQWRWHVDKSTADEVKLILTTGLPHAPYRLEREISLPGERIVRVRDQITNLSDQPMEFDWGQHIAYGAPFLSEHCRLTIPGRRIYTARPDNSRLPAGVRAWPEAKGEEDLRNILASDARTRDFGVVSDLETGAYQIENPDLGVGVRVAWNLDAYPHLWLWQEFCGSSSYPFYNRAYVMGVEPSSTDTEDGLNASLSRGCGLGVLPHERKESVVDFTVTNVTA